MRALSGTLVVEVSSRGQKKQGYRRRAALVRGQQRTPSPRSKLPSFNSQPTIDHPAANRRKILHPIVSAPPYASPVAAAGQYISEQVSDCHGSASLFHRTRVGRCWSGGDDATGLVAARGTYLQRFRLKTPDKLPLSGVNGWRQLCTGKVVPCASR